ncbi:hypothetical protein HU200_067347 [Digitaria exilis]|uniref:F-box domain-containing protein n=1 Tax=Digitaria exilis TaxID=1010633 RepID=A0A835DS96_9POAL|nr:hypothetical protein HU200_067347 [Digitaria exilis]
MESNIVHRSKRLKGCHNEPMLRQKSAKTKLSDLSEDVLGVILSKLPTKEIVRTSILSSKWKQIWTVCPKLRLDSGIMCCKYVTGTQLSMQKFIENVNAVIKQYNGKLVEELEVKFEFDSKLAEHLYGWISFALSSGAKNLALDLLPVDSRHRCDQYRFPFELFDGGSISRLQQMQLSFVSFESLPQFCGFPNLKKLDLHFVRANQIGLPNMLANCISLEWLSIVTCHLDGELTVVHPLPRLLYLRIAHCGLSKIEFSAMNLQTFVYTGAWLPIYLGHALELKDASLRFIGKVTLEDALVALPNMLPKVRNLTLRCFISLETPVLLGNCLKFLQLKYLQLGLFVKGDDQINILYLASFLNAAPFIEKLELHFTLCASSRCSEVIKRLPRCTHNHLKSLKITGFAGCTGQVEFLVHVVENAPNLETLTIDRVDYFGFGIDQEYERRSRCKALDIAKRHLDGRVSEKTNVCIT